MLQIQQLNSTIQLTDSDLNQVYGGDDNFSLEERQSFLDGFIRGEFTIEFGDDPVDARVRNASTGDVIAEGVRFFEL